MPALNGLLGERLPGRTSYKLMRFAKQVQENFAIYDEARKKMVEKYGTKQKDGSYKIPKKSEKAVDKEFKEILEIEEEYDLKKIKLPKKIEITPRDMLVLEDILELEDE